MTQIEKRLAEIADRKSEIRGKIMTDMSANLTDMQSELVKLDDEVKQLEARKSILDGVNNNIIHTNEVKPLEQRDFANMKPIEVRGTNEYRSAFFKRLANQEMTDIEKRALTTGDDSTGATVPTQTYDLITQKLRQTVALLPEISTSYVPGNMKFPVQNAINDASWHTQGDNITGTDDTTGYVSLGGFELVRLVQVSKAALQMSIPALESYVVDQLSKRMSVGIENSILNGAGTDEPTGILTGVTFDSNNNSTYAKTGLKFDDLLNFIALLPTMYHPNAKFVMSRKTLFTQVRTLQTADGFPVFFLDPTQKGSMLAFGYPVIMDDYIPDGTFLFGDYTYYRQNYSQGAMIEKSLESSFKNNLVDFKGTLIMDGKPLLSEAFCKMTKAA